MESRFHYTEKRHSFQDNTFTQYTVYYIHIHTDTHTPHLLYINKTYNHTRSVTLQKYILFPPVFPKVRGTSCVSFLKACQRHDTSS